MSTTTEEQAPEPAPAGTARPVLVERDRELAHLRQAADAAASGGARFVLVSGESGIGKSRLVRELVATLDGTWSHAALTVERGVLGVAGRQAPSVAADAPPAAAIGSTLARALAAIGPRGPVLATIDGLDGLDPVHVLALDEALGASTGTPVLVVATLLPGSFEPGSEEAQALSRVLRRPSARSLPLEPLSVEGVAALAASLGHAGADARELHARTGGNPFFVEELLVAPGGAPSWTITEAVLDRVAGLDRPARTAAEVLAVAGGPLSRRALEAVTGDRSAALALLDAGIAVSDERGGVVLRHAIVAEVVAERLSAEDRRAHHESVATALAADPDAPAAQLARHWHAAGRPEAAARSAEVAAAEATAGRAYRTATELYRIALAGPTGDPMRRAELLDRAAVAAGWAGFERDAMAWAQAADDAYRRAGEAWRAIAMWMGPGLSNLPKPSLDAALLADDAVERLFADGRDLSRAQDHERAAEVLRRALQLAEPDRADHWAIEIGLQLVGTGHLREGEDLLQRVRAAAVARGDRVTASRALTMLAYVSMGRGEMAHALVIDRQALEAARADGEAAAWPVVAGLSTLHAYLGDLDAADEGIAALRADPSALAGEFAHFPACVVDLERGDLEAAREKLERMGAVAALGIAHLTVGVLSLRARAALLDGDPQAALGLLAEAESVSGHLFEPTRPDRLVLRARAAVAAGEPDAVDEVLVALAELVDLGGGQDIAAAAATADGLAAALRGGGGGAAARLAEAAERWERARRASHAAATWCDAAEAAARDGDVRARDHAVARARSLAEPRGLHPILGRLAAVGDIAAGPAGHPALVDLTAREREIALEVAQGKTNREIGDALFISEHTVRNQLVAVFAKLGIARRAELIRLLAPPGP